MSKHEIRRFHGNYLSAWGVAKVGADSTFLHSLGGLGKRRKVNSESLAFGKATGIPIAKM